MSQKVTTDRHLEMRQIAAKLVLQAKQEGKLPKLNGISCVDCGSPATVWEHRDYQEPLKVDPTCSSCNTKRGKAKPEIDLRTIEGQQFIAKTDVTLADLHSIFGCGNLFESKFYIEPIEGSDNYRVFMSMKPGHAHWHKPRRKA